MLYFDQVAFGQRLKDLRAEKGLPQEAFAEEIGISASHYKHMESGSIGCSIDLLLVLSETFHVSTDYLLTGRSIERDEEIAELKQKMIELVKRL